ncbi:MAG: hypothetical protein KF712_00195 [Akkermansiaceae bacterium]|nr:hypothetical protein [Akkermansiaceae bacterium]
MTENIKSQITALPDSEIQPLLEWLRSYYDGPVWDRQIDEDIERLGIEEWQERLGREFTDEDQHEAERRVLNAIEPCDDGKRVAFVQDLAFLLGRPMESYSRTLPGK